MHPADRKWSSDFFGNDRPLILELGCGKGEYTLALARQDYNINFIGITTGKTSFDKFSMIYVLHKNFFEIVRIRNIKLCILQILQDIL